MSWTVGDISASETLTDSDHLYVSHINELRTAHDNRFFKTVGGNDTEFPVDGTNDEIQIQAAIDELPSTGGIVFLKAGTYNLESLVNSAYTFHSGVSYYCLVLKNKVRLIGEGIGKTILNNTSFYSGASVGTGVIINGALGDTGQSVEDMTIQCPAFTSGDSAIWGGAPAFRGSTGTILRDLKIINGAWEFRGNTVSFSTSTKILTTDCSDILVDNVTVDPALGSSSLVSVNDVLVKRCKFYNFHDDAHIVVGGGQHLTYLACHFDGQDLVDADGGSNALLYFANDGSVSTDLYVMRDIKVIGCTLRRLTGLTKSGSQAGISLSECRDMKISDCLIEGNAGPGVYDNGGHNTENIDILDNTIRDNGASTSDGIRFRIAVNNNDHKHLSIRGNKIYNNNTVGIAVRAQNAGNTIDSLIIEDNDLWDDQDTPTQTTGIAIATNNATAVISNAQIKNNNIRDATTLIDIDTGSGGTITAQVRDNTGYVTENSGTATLVNGTTSIAVNHGLSRTPAAGDIVITPIEAWGAMTEFYIDTYTATQFTIHADQDPGQDVDFVWKAIVTRTTF